jgi:hypothetical protein
MTTGTETIEHMISPQQISITLEKEIQIQLDRRVTILLLGASVLLVAGHYTFGEWVFHPKLALWREKTFWLDGCKLIVWPVVLWLFWLVASFGRINSAPAILVIAGIILLGDWVWYSVGEYLRDSELEIPPDYWSWWLSWASSITITGNIVLALRWIRLIRFRSIQPTNKQVGWQSSIWLKVGIKLATFLLVYGALLLSLVYLGLPQLMVTKWSLAGARVWLVREGLREDFDFLVANGGLQWHRYRLAALLQNVELSDQQRHQFYANLNEPTYQNYVLSPEICELPLQELNWRRVLWVFFYPYVSHSNDPAGAAKIVVRLLRERVGIEPTSGFAVGVETIWQEGVTDEKGFDRIYVAAMRAIGIAARLNGNARAELWNGRNWEPAPRPLITSFSSGKAIENY